MSPARKFWPEAVQRSPKGTGSCLCSCKMWCLLDLDLVQVSADGALCNFLVAILPWENGRGIRACTAEWGAIHGSSAAHSTIRSRSYAGSWSSCKSRSHRIDFKLARHVFGETLCICNGLKPSVHMPQPCSSASPLKYCLSFAFEASLLPDIPSLGGNVGSRMHRFLNAMTHVLDVFHHWKVRSILVSSNWCFFSCSHLRWMLPIATCGCFAAALLMAWKPTRSCNYCLELTLKSGTRSYVA